MFSAGEVILLGEDSEDYEILFCHTMQRAGVRSKIVVLKNGKEVVDYLKGAGKYADREKFPLPSIIFTDIKMPLMDGFQVLSWVKQQPGLSHVPVVILTNSIFPEDFDLAVRLGALACLDKPFMPEHVEMVREKLEEVAAA